MQQTHVPASGRVKLNALVWGDDLEQVDRLLAQGYGCLKVKVGRLDLAQDIERVKQIKASVNDRASIRLDANRSWSLDQAVTFAKAVGSGDIEYIEEPTVKTKDHVAFYHATGMSYAWDESLSEQRLAEQDGLAALVIKPACVGSIARVDEFVDWAKAHNKQTVISSVFESDRVLEFYAHYCLTQGLESMCHGLDTWRWFKQSYVHVEQGVLVVEGKA